MPHLFFLEILVSGNVKNLTPQLGKFHTSAHIIRLVEEVINTSWYGKYPIVYKLFDTIPGGCLGFLNHQRRCGWRIPNEPQLSRSSGSSRVSDLGDLVLLNLPGWGWPRARREDVPTKRWWCVFGDMGVSLNGGTPKSSILIGFSIINHPF